MRKVIFSILALFLAHLASAQILEPVKWEWSLKNNSDSEAELIYTAKIDPKWAVYSQYLPSDDGPIKTSINYDSQEGFVLQGKSTEAGHKKEGHDELFDMNVIKFFDNYTITQKIKITDPKAIITGYIEFMTCDDQRCLPPTEVPFEFDLSQTKTVEKKKVTESTPTPVVPAAETKKKESESAVQSKSANQNQEKSVTKAEPKVEEIKPLSPTLSTKKTSTPVKWTGDVAGDTLELHGQIDDGWKIYTQDQPSEEYSIIPLTITVDGEPIKFEASSPHITVKNDPIFDEKLSSVNQSITYSLPRKDLPEEFDLKVEFMACDHEACIFPEPWEMHVSGNEFLDPITSETSDNQLLSSELYSLPKPNLSEIDNSCVVTSESTEINKKSWLTIFLLGFGGGLLALLTPCVFPMIPLTVSFFTKSHEKSHQKGVYQAFMYGFFIFSIYLLLSIPFHLVDTMNPDILNSLSTSVPLNLLFFVIFVVFAFSFFGYYELTLPSKWINQSSSSEGKGGLIGVFFMALTLALVSFSCTGPILGSLLAGALSSDGGAWQLTMGMMGFGLALALPFGLFAAAPKLMAKLPKSGSWMETVKVSLGFIELALAFKFLSNADLVKQWGLLKIEPFYVIWIMCAFGLALFLFGFLKFPHTPSKQKISTGRAIGGLVAVAAAFYLISGFRFNKDYGTYQPLELMSGLAPPVGYSWLHPSDCPQSLACFKDLDKGLKVAEEEQKPILLDFTGYACVNCRKMEELVWPTKQVKDLLNDDYLLVSLYVDDKSKLDEEIVVNRANDAGTRTLKKKGEIWQHLQTTYFNNNSQPFYVLLSPDGKVLNQPVGYTPNPVDFANFLKCGIDAMENKPIGDATEQ